MSRPTVRTAKLPPDLWASLRILRREYYSSEDAFYAEIAEATPDYCLRGSRQMLRTALEGKLVRPEIVEALRITELIIQRKMRVGRIKSRTEIRRTHRGEELVKYLAEREVWLHATDKRESAERVRIYDLIIKRLRREIAAERRIK